MGTFRAYFIGQLGKYVPGKALALWMQRYAEFITTKRGLATALHSGDAAYNSLPAYFDTRLRPALRTLLGHMPTGRFEVCTHHAS